MLFVVATLRASWSLVALKTSRQGWGGGSSLNCLHAPMLKHHTFRQNSLAGHV